MSAITVDGVSYSKIHVTELKRSFSVLDGPNSSRALTGEMRRDIIGTYYNYSLTLVPDQSQGSISQYDALYEVLSAPEESHTIKVPYAQGYKTFRAYVTSGDDALMYKGPSSSKWDGLTVNFIAMSPERTPA